MPERTKHCTFKKLNGGGRCIAPCHLNGDGVDCIGLDAVPSDGPHYHEIPVTCGFIDGRNVQLDAKGYRVIEKAPEKVVPKVTMDDGEETWTDTVSGWTYQWKTTVAGLRYKAYISGPGKIP